MKHESLTEQIIKVYYQVYNELGHGFLERVYQNAFYLALKQAGLEVEAHRKIKVWFRGVDVGEYIADLVVNKLIIIELKAAESIIDDNEFIKLANIIHPCFNKLRTKCCRKMLLNVAPSSAKTMAAIKNKITKPSCLT